MLCFSHCFGVVSGTHWYLVVRGCLLLNLMHVGNFDPKVSSSFNPSWFNTFLLALAKLRLHSSTWSSNMKQEGDFRSWKYLYSRVCSNLSTSHAFSCAGSAGLGPRAISKGNVIDEHIGQYQAWPNSKISQSMFIKNTAIHVDTISWSPGFLWPNLYFLCESSANRSTYLRVHSRKVHWLSMYGK